MTEAPFIVIEGNIGVGKTSLAKALSDKWGYRLLLEEFEENPFLSQFYTDKEKYGLQTELRFMLDRFRQLNTALANNEPVIADYFIEKSLIFAENTLSTSDLNLFKELYQILFQKLKKPDLYVYLSADVNRLQTNIKRRNRRMETKISSEYLEKINKGYLKYVSAHKELNYIILDVSKLDFMKFSEHLAEIDCLIQKNRTRN